MPPLFWLPLQLSACSAGFCRLSANHAYPFNTTSHNVDSLYTQSRSNTGTDAACRCFKGKATQHPRQSSFLLCHALRPTQQNTNGWHAYLLTQWKITGSSLQVLFHAVKPLLLTQTSVFLSLRFYTMIRKIGLTIIIIIKKKQFS